MMFGFGFDGGAPGGWERRLQETWLEPEQEGAAGDKPRANIVVSQQNTQKPTSSEAARDEFLEQSAGAIPGLEILAIGELGFSDGGSGAMVRLSFLATESLRLMQTHVFRLEEGLLTQIAATVSEAEGDRLDATGDLGKLVCSIAIRGC